LVDAFHVPKLLSRQLLLFGRSGDGLEELTFGVEQFSALSVPRTVCVDLEDGPRRACSSRVLRVLARLRFRSTVFSSFGWAKFRRSACAGRTVRRCLANSPRAPRGRSVIRGASLEVLVSFSDSPWLRPDGPRQGSGQSAIPCQTVRAAFADCLPRLAGQSARGWQLCSLVRFLPPSFVLPRVLQGIVPKT
jgi:hypothetical protein